MDQENLTKVAFGSNSIRGNWRKSDAYRIVASGIGNDEYKGKTLLLDLPDPPLHMAVHKYIIDNADEMTYFEGWAKLTNRSTRSDTDFVGHIRRIIVDTRVSVPDEVIFSRKRKWCKDRDIYCFQRNGKFFWDNGKYPGYYAAMTAFELIVDDPKLLRKGEKYP